MISQPHITRLLLIACLVFPNCVPAASRQSFCKCVCGSNSTIIPLDGKPVDPPPQKYRPSSRSSSSSILQSSTSTSASSSSSSTIQFLDLPRASGSPDEIHDPADEGFGVTQYADDTSHVAKRQDEEADDGTGDEDDVVDPLAHANTADLEGFGHASTATTPTSSMSIVTGAFSSASSTASAEAKEDESSPGNSTDTQLVSPQRAGTCADCNRQFCLEHPDFDKMCGEAKEEEVFTTCFQRDSAKDQLVVYTFIIVTVALLGYAAVRPWMEKKYQAVRERRSYSAVPGGPGNG